MVHLLGLHDALGEDSHPSTVGVPTEYGPHAFREARDPHVPRSSLPALQVRDVVPKDSAGGLDHAGAVQPSAFEVCSIFGTSDGSPEPSTTGLQRWRVRGAPRSKLTTSQPRPRVVDRTDGPPLNGGRQQHGLLSPPTDSSAIMLLAG